MGASVRYGTSIPIHLHLAETEGEVKDSLDRFGLTPVRYLYKLGILSPRLIIAHGIYVDDDEIRMLADHGVKVVHNPASNMKLPPAFNSNFVRCERPVLLSLWVLTVVLLPIIWI